MRDKFRLWLLAGGLLIVGPMPVLADAPPAVNAGAPGRCDMDSHPPGPPGRPGSGPGDDTRAPPFLMGVALSEDQQDRVFSIMHAAAPALRDREKSAHKAREALHQLVRSPSFSESSAAALAQAQGAAESQLALIRTKMEHDVYAVLTPDQQSTITTREKECDFRARFGGMPPGGPGPH